MNARTGPPQPLGARRKRRASLTRRQSGGLDAQAGGTRAAIRDKPAFRLRSDEGYECCGCVFAGSQSVAFQATGTNR